MRLFAAVLLLIALVPFGWSFLGRRRTSGRRGYPAMVRSSWLRFGLPAIALLGVAGRWPSILYMPAEFAPVAARLGLNDLTTADRQTVLLAAVCGVGIGLAGGLSLTAWRAWRGRPEGTMFGDARAVLPQGPQDYGWAALVCVTAGLTEEAYFRLLLPLLATLASGSAVAGFLGATLLFGAAHRYQGWRGVVATTVAGTALSVGYLATGSLLAMMAVHAAGDLGHLVLRPAFRLAIERRRSGGSARVR